MNVSPDITHSNNVDGASNLQCSMILNEIGNRPNSAVTAALVAHFWSLHLWGYYQLLGKPQHEVWNGSGCCMRSRHQCSFCPHPSRSPSLIENGTYGLGWFLRRSSSQWSKVSGFDNCLGVSGFGVLLLWVGSTVSGVLDVGRGGLGSWGSWGIVDLVELLPDTDDQGASLERECTWILRDSISSFLEDRSCRTEHSSSSMHCFCNSISLRSSYVEEWHCISQFIRSSRSIISLDCWALIFYSLSSWLIISVCSWVSCSIVPFHKDFSPSGKQLEHRKLAHEL